MSVSSSPSAASFPACLPGDSRIHLSLNSSTPTLPSAAPEFEQFQGTLATQEYIQACITVWLYESLRQILLELNDFTVRLGSECNQTTCPKMCATENWMFLCAAHSGKQPKECCAIDYILHTLTSFTLLLTSNDTFPNRYTITPKSAQQFGNIARRLYRVFAHAYYHHRNIFDEIESRSHLTKRFLEFSLKHELMTPAQLAPAIDI